MFMESNGWSDGIRNHVAEPVAGAIVGNQQTFANGERFGKDLEIFGLDAVRIGKLWIAR